ncbi:hypothetical protein HHI36_017268 [Cryptolaemus montrouzieri]|uniref:TIR domain-containing protein n=1 Tax=Cryptolaemus montrouzieri TaxID=559131 RepID=A0ABD2NMB3_9CUCU
MNLENLYLQHNNLREITINLLKHLTKLKELDLSYNDILNIHLDAFSRTKNLVKLSLSHNQYNYQDVSIFPVSPFNKCGNLQEIDLSHNNIQDFPEDLMLLTSMKTIDLSWNNIKSLRVNALWKVTISELKIDLEHNQISRLNFEGVEVTALQQPDLDAYHNVGASAVINISENPIICDCFAIDFVRYIQDEIYPGVKTAIFFLYDNVKCASPEIFEHISIEEITPAMLSCPLEDVIENFTCTNSDRCVCAWRPFDYSLIVDCDNKNLTSIPEIYQPMKLIFNQTEVHLEGNYLTKGPAADSVGFENVSKLYLGSNKIDEIEWIPPRLKILHLHDNKLEKIHHQVLEQLNSTQIQNISLNGNLWKCDCAAANLTNFLRQHVHQIDTSQIFCDRSNKLLINLNDKDLCPHNSFLLASITSLIFLLCILTSVAAFYYKFQQEIKVWMYAHNICLFLIEEEELDKDKIYDVFVSYSHKDEDFVLENLVAVLENGPKPYKLCVHFRNWIPGEFISTQVTSSVRDSRRTMVILSSNFLESVWGKMEFRTAHSEAMREGRARVIIVLIGDINIDSLDDELRAYMKTNTYIKWGDPWFWDKLKYALPHSKLDRVDIQSQKHANMMKYIDDKFSLVKGKTSSENSSTTSISIKNGKKLDVELDIDEDAIIKHEII